MWLVATVLDSKATEPRPLSEGEDTGSFGAQEPYLSALGSRRFPPAMMTVLFSGGGGCQDRVGIGKGALPSTC